MSNHPLVSIIVPVYKVEPYLRKCLDSILAQTFKDFEAIVVDDGSPDQCGAICDEYAQKDARIRVIHKKNAGVSSARNTALDVCHGEYVMFVDSDDWVEPNFCEEALRLIFQHKVQLVSFGYNKIIEGKTDSIRRKCTSSPRIMSSSEALRHLILLDEVIYNYSWNKIYSRHLFDDVRFPEGMDLEDYVTIYKLFHRAGKVYVSDVVLYDYLKRESSYTGNIMTSKLYATRFTIWNMRLEDIKIISPENVNPQICKLATDALEGIMCIDKNSEYGYILPKMRKFLEDHQELILKDLPLFKFKIYYFARPLLPLYYMTRKCKGRVGQLIKGLKRT